MNDNRDARRGGRGWTPRPTLIERLLLVVPLPYLVSSVLFVLLFTAPLQIAVKWAATGDFGLALSGFFMTTYAPATPLQQILAVAVWTLWPLFILWQLRYIRRRIGGLERDMLALLPDGHRSYAAAFAPIGRLLPPALVTLVIMLIQAPPLLQMFALDTSPLVLIFDVVRAVGIYLLYANVLWMYGAGLWGVYRLGRQPLRLAPLDEDPSMGATPFGRLSLLLTASFFANVAIMLFILAISPVDFSFLLLLIALALIGSALFFLPLYAVHGQMLREKGRWHAAAVRQLMRLTIDPVKREMRGAPQSDTDESGARRVYYQAGALEMAERRIAGAPTWPVNVSILARLGGAMAIPVLVALISRFLITLFGI